MRNKIAFITGGGGYIGGETAYALAKAGVEVAVCDLSSETAQKTVQRITEAGGKAKAYVADVTDSAEIDSVINTAFEDFGGLDMMIHVAGGSAREKQKPLVEQTDDVIQSVININLMGAIYASRAAARLMIKQGTGGKIINFSSIVAVNGLTSCVDYAAAKGGVMSMTRALAKELGPYQINVNSVAPGVVARPGQDTDPNYIFGTNLLNKKCLASDVADLVEFLVSDKANFITGQTYVIDGGRSLSMKGTD